MRVRRVWFTLMSAITYSYVTSDYWVYISTSVTYDVIQRTYSCGFMLSVKGGFGEEP